ncbi:PBSX family phage terminase large subunit [Dysgonomonas macrotermitis]|uniref:Phage terminase large subunit n=1 Tax=Dysgonomonas macrotermitis TaxID=1346286 RepID=A0A1M5F3V9_9BACT|nr:terminase large subunit [Dysgonomonas macrotermitis]SHF85782.1 phage terminase large subunit [Dysgonomonas macrotermitis]
MKVTSVFNRNLEAYNQEKRIIVNKGSTRSSKTWSILQLLYLIAESSSVPRLISIVSESMPHLKKGCIRDFENMLRTENKWDRRAWNATDKMYTVNHSRIEFFSADQPAKVHGPARDILYMNECINVPFETYRQLAIRTRETIFLDYNPSHEFWVDEKVLTRAESVLIHSTYLDNDFLTDVQVQEIESNKKDAEWWQVYGLGQTGSKIGLIMQNWEIVPSLPSTYKQRWVGIDFGFTNDPTAIVEVRLAEGALWMRELLYARGYDNIMIGNYMDELNIPHSISIVADSAEPKSISEIRHQGWAIEPANKGRDSILAGLSILNRYHKYLTGDSTNLIKEFRNYRWMTDVSGNPTNTPIDRYNHAIDALRYVALNKMSRKGNFDYYIKR